MSPQNIRLRNTLKPSSFLFSLFPTTGLARDLLISGFHCSQPLQTEAITRPLNSTFLHGSRPVQLLVSVLLFHTAPAVLQVVAIVDHKSIGKHTGSHKVHLARPTKGRPWLLTCSLTHQRKWCSRPIFWESIPWLSSCTPRISSPRGAGCRLVAFQVRAPMLTFGLGTRVYQEQRNSAVVLLWVQVAV